MHGGLLPLEGFGGLVVGGDESVDSLAQLLGRGEAGALEGTAAQDREPDLDLIEPARVGRREVEVHVGVTLEPAVALGFMGREIVENDVDLAIRIRGDEPVHEGEELAAPSARGVPGNDCATGNVEGGEERCRAMPLVLVGKAGVIFRRKSGQV